MSVPSHAYWQLFSIMHRGCSLVFWQQEYRCMQRQLQSGFGTRISNLLGRKCVYSTDTFCASRVGNTLSNSSQRVPWFCWLLENLIIWMHSLERDGTDKSEILMYSLHCLLNSNLMLCVKFPAWRKVPRRAWSVLHFNDLLLNVHNREKPIGTVIKSNSENRVSR